MQSTQKLANAFRSLLALVEEEAARNPEFAARLEEISSPLPASPKKRAISNKSAGPAESLPNVFAMCQEKGDQEFRFWLRSLNPRLLKGIVKANGFDPGKTSQRWTEPDKYVELISEQTAARLRRGSAFLTPKGSKDEEPGDA
jgi:hypothetical protein